MNILPGLDADRLKRAISAFVRELFPNLDYYRPHLYQVATWDFGSQTASLVPSASTSGMPTLGSVPLRSIYDVTLPLGTEVVVWFDNGDPTSPFIGSIGRASGFGNQADAIDLSRTDDTIPVPSPPLTSRRVVRYGDTIMMPFGAPGTPTPTVVSANTLLSGSFSKVKA